VVPVAIELTSALVSVVVLRKVAARSSKVLLALTSDVALELVETAAERLGEGGGAVTDASGVVSVPVGLWWAAVLDAESGWVLASTNC